MACQVVLGAVAHVRWCEAVKAVGPSPSAIFMNFQPVVGVLLAALLLGESVAVVELLGGCGVLLAWHWPPDSRRPGRAGAPPRPARVGRSSRAS